MSIWTDLAQNLGTQLAGAVGSEVINRIQTRLRGDNPQQAFFDAGPWMEPWSDVGLTSGLPAIIGAGAESIGLIGGAKRKRRRMNSTNVHALRRALRRVESFVKIEKRVDKIVNRTARASGAARRHGFVRGGRRGAASQPGTQVINVD